MKSLKFLVCIFLTISIISSISSCKGSKEISLSSDMLTADSWELQALKGEVLLAENYMKGLPNLKFEDGSAIKGSTGCNQFFGKYELVGDELLLSPEGMTKMACPGSGEMDFLKAIAEVSQASVKDGKLILMNDGAVTLLTFSKMSKN